MKKLLVFVLLIPFAFLTAGFYGMLHNQISFTVSPEYFTKFKFDQFRLTASQQPERIKASIVGYHAAKNMGIPIGVLVGAMGFIHRGHRRMLKISLWSLAVVVGFTLLFGLCGIAYGYWQTREIDLNEYRNWFIPKNVTNLRRFLCAGYMHNAAYLGGALSIFFGWAFHIAAKFREDDSEKDSLTA